MASLLLRTLNRFRRVACLGIMSAGCLTGVHVFSDIGYSQQTNQPQSNLESLFSREALEIVDVPPMFANPVNGLPAVQSHLSPLRQPATASQSALPAQSRFLSAPLVRSESVREIIRTAEKNTATRMTASVRTDVGNSEGGRQGLVARLKNKQGWQQPQSMPSSQKMNESQPKPSQFNALQVGYQQTAGPNTSQPNVHESVAKVARHVQTTSAIPTPAPPRIGNLVPTLAISGLSGIHRIKNMSMTEFESALVKSMGAKLKTFSSTDGRYVRVEMPNRIGKSMKMLVDRENQTLSYEGAAELKGSWHRLVANLDYYPVVGENGVVRQVSVVDPGKANLQLVRKAAFLVGIYQDPTAQDELSQQNGQPATPDVVQDTTGQTPANGIPAAQVPEQDRLMIPQGSQADLPPTLKGKIQFIDDPNTGFVTLLGDPDDIDLVIEIMSKIAAKSDLAQPVVENVPLSNIQSEAFEERIQELYDDSFQLTNGPAQITAITSPNMFLVIAQPEGVEAVRKIVAQMDVEKDTTAAGGHESFRLKYISATDAKLRLDDYFGQGQNSGAGENQLSSAPVVTIADFRSNIITVKGGKQFIEDARRYLAEIDVIDSPTTNEVRVFSLKNTLAEEMALVIQDAVNGQQTNSGQGYNPSPDGQQDTAGGNNLEPTESHLRSPALSLKTIGKDGEVITSGIMFDVRVTADRNSNSLVVAAPSESMPLIEELIKQLDRVPEAETLIKVFQIVNGDAETLLAMLETLFQANNQGGGGGGNQAGDNLSLLPLQGASATDGSTLVNLRFTIDTRTNSIIASGPAGDLQVVEDLLNRLDEQDINERTTEVYRLSNAPVLDVAEAVNAWLDARATNLADDPRAIGGINQTNRNVIVEAEVASNSLIISARPEYHAEILKVIKALDRRPAIVHVKVLIAEVDLDRVEEFGVDIGVQDSLLFDRGTSVAADGALTGIGFPFNSSSVANANGTFQETLAGQALSNLGTGRTNTNLGYGGLVLSAGNESISVLMRALQDKQCVRVLSKPTIETMENVQGRITVGAEVPRVSGTTSTNFGITQNVEFVDVGVILEVTPRVGQDGMIVMEVNAKKSSVGPDATGITIAIGADGTPIRSPQIIEAEANTTLMARHGQTVVFAGLIQEEKTHTERGAPILSDLPFIGPLFKFESDQSSRTELLIIMTPYIVSDDEDRDLLNQDNMDRVHWCLSDVAEVYGNTDYEGYQGQEGAVETYYPDTDPSGMQPQGYSTEMIQAPAPNYQQNTLTPQVYDSGSR